MILPIIFYASGALIALLVLTKTRELKTRRQPLLLRVISLGDERMKDLSHRTAHLYADSKEDLKFFWQKQLPLHTKNTWNKLVALFEEKMKLLISDLRSTRLLKKSGDISEFFQSLSDRETEAEEARMLEEETADSQKVEDRVE